MSAAIEGKSFAEPSHVEEFGSGPSQIDITRFEAKRPQQDPYSHGYRIKNTENKKLSSGSLTHLGHKGPANKNNGFLIVLKEHCSQNIDNAYLAEMPRSLSDYA